MSDLLHLATDLRARSDEQVLALLRRRLQVGAPKDFFDLAQALLAPKSLNSALHKLSGSEARALGGLLAGQASEALSQSALRSLSELGLIRESAGRWLPYEAVRELGTPVLANIPEDTHRLATAKAVEETVDPAILGLAAISAFETQQAVCELLIDAEQHPLRFTGKTGFGVSDVKRLAAHLRRSVPAVRGYYKLAEQLHLFLLIDERWRLSGAAEQFLNATILQRWVMLAEQWITALGPIGGRELLAVLTSHEEIHLSAALKLVFPLADAALGEELELLSGQAQGIGFSVSDKPNLLLTLCLQGSAAAAADLLQAHLPQLQHSLIVQADLSLIAPGPLDTATETILRKFTEIEQVSVASSYRLSALSVSHGLECGLTTELIRNMLLELNGRDLPQPVEYLLREGEARFGRLTIGVGRGAAEKSVLRSTENVLLTEILNDSRLRAFAFVANTASGLATRFEPEVVYFGLREHGYLPVMVDADGAVISPRGSHTYTGGLAVQGANPMQLLIDNLRAADERVGKQPDDQDLTRQIQLALKNKTQLRIYALDRTGNEVAFRIQPTALANGRLRGMDKASDVERTIPLERIARVELG